MILVYSILTGVVCGVVFTLLRLPIPAPPALPGILGIVGVYLGFLIVTFFRP
jgi:XapX domain-containing protein